MRNSGDAAKTVLGGEFIPTFRIACHLELLLSNATDSMPVKQLKSDPSE